MNNRRVAHLWANQAKPHARGSNFYFDGPALYSYGGHFCVGRIVENKRGRRAYLLNSDAYSPSTSRHQRYARNAIAGGATVFYVPGASTRHSDNRERFRDRMRAALARIGTRRTADRIRGDIVDARDAAQAFNDYSAFFGLHGRLKLPTFAPVYAARAARYESNAEKRHERKRAEWEAGAPAREAAERARLQEQAERCAKEREEFRAGLPRRSYGSLGPCMLRLSGNTFKTSQGADVPRAEGVAMLRFIAARLRGGMVPFQAGEDGRAAPVAGGFTLRRISRDEVVIGCHHIPVSECAAMAALVGVEWPVS